MTFTLSLCKMLIMAESDVRSYIQSLGIEDQLAIANYAREEDAALLASLRNLSKEDVRLLCMELVGRGSDSGDFIARMKEAGWHFRLDTSPDAPTYGHNEHGYPILGSTVDFPGGTFSITIADIARVTG